MWAGLWVARLRIVSRPRPAVPPVMKIILLGRGGMNVVGSKFKVAILYIFVVRIKRRWD
jgi:hypothetical protein